MVVINGMLSPNALIVSFWKFIFTSIFFIEDHEKSNEMSLSSISDWMWICSPPIFAENVMLSIAVIFLQSPKRYIWLLGVYLMFCYWCSGKFDMYWFSHSLPQTVLLAPQSSKAELQVSDIRYMSSCGLS